MTGPVVTAEMYARWRDTPLGAITERVETALIFALAGPLHGKRLLDVGTGDGHYAIRNCPLTPFPQFRKVQPDPCLRRQHLGGV